MLVTTIILAVIIYVWILAYHNVSLPVWTASLLAGLLLLSVFTSLSFISLLILWTIVVLPLMVLNVLSLRRKLLSKTLFNFFRRSMPAMSTTEKEALAAGMTGWEAELLSGDPDWERLLAQPGPSLSVGEQAFLDGPVNELCSMIDDWDITHNRADLPAEIWAYIKEHRFWGLIIPEKYGGLAFSASAQVAVLSRIHGRSASVATTVMVPNSLGPAELLLKYGLAAQQEYYLPRLACGEEIPCFALTAPTAGSDAAAIPDRGDICHGEFQGKSVIGIRLQWDKRYITLAPVATVIGLAFHLFDPEHLLSKKVDRGITCALIPANTAGVSIGRRHFPLNSAFMNGPIQGKDVFIPLDWIIGGEEMIGRGWQMLMECLGVGRAISLPAGANGGAQTAALATGAYARIRQQFSVPIGFFEGVEETLTTIAGNTYIINAAVKLGAAAIDNDVKSAVASAIVKQQTTERGRQVVLAAMDVHGGKGICMGPRNYIASAYQTVPISITVEGANILTRSFIIFGQGLIRCHPYLLAEIQSVETQDLVQFDKALFNHFAYMGSRKIRALFLALTQGRFVPVANKSLKRYFQLATRYSGALAFMAELAIIGLRGNLKRCEKLSGRFADVLSLLYLISAVLKRFIDDGKPAADRVLVDWSCQQLLYNIEQRLWEIYQNFPSRFLAFSMRFFVFPLGRRCQLPGDKLSQQVAQLLLTPSPARQRLTADVYQQALANNPIGLMEQYLPIIIAAEPLERRLKQAERAGKITGLSLPEQVTAALVADLINQDEAEQLLQADRLRQAVIAVDDFSSSELVRLTELNVMN